MSVGLCKLKMSNVFVPLLMSRADLANMLVYFMLF